MPGRLTRPRASFTSSTLLGRTMALISFISCLQRPVELRGQLRDRRVGQLGASLCDVEHIDCLFALRRNQHEVDVTAVSRDDAADTMQQTERDRKSGV